MVVMTSPNLSRLFLELFKKEHGKKKENISRKKTEGHAFISIIERKMFCAKLLTLLGECLLYTAGQGGKRPGTYKRPAAGYSF